MRRRNVTSQILSVSTRPTCSESATRKHFMPFSLPKISLPLRRSVKWKWKGRLKDVRGTVRCRRMCAVACILTIVVLWLSMAELVQGVEAKFEKPYLVRFAAHAFYSSAFLIWIPWRLAPCTKPERGNYLGYFNWCYFFGASIPLAIAAFVSGYLWYLSLPRTSVSGNTAIFQSMSAMVYIFSIALLGERPTRLKTTCVAVSVTGVLFVSFCGTPEPSGDAKAALVETHSEPSALGYVLCFFSMVLYALFEVLYKKWASHSADPLPIMNSVRFLGLLGISTIMFCGPPLMLFDVAGWEAFEFPSEQMVGKIVLLGLLDTAFNLFMLFAIMLSSPLFTSVGCLLVLPISLIWDSFAHGYGLPLGGLVGVGFIFAGFAGFLVDEFWCSKATRESLYNYEVVKLANPEDPSEGEKEDTGPQANPKANAPRIQNGG
eukprot:Polyplicarium_translucidae@DN3241_c0_g1_i1.p1